MVETVLKRVEVSVCVPIYNQGRYLRDCIESVLQQTFTDWELVICDDCSTDNTALIVSEYSRNDLRIRYILNPCRLGMFANLKRVAECATGKFIKILCSDDWLTPECLATFCSALKAHPQVVLATSAEIHTDQSGSPKYVQFLFGTSSQVIKGNEMLARMSKGEGFGGNSSFFIRANAYHEAGGFDASIQYAGDYELAARLCRIGDYYHTDEPLFYGRDHPESSSSVNPRRFLDVIDWLVLPGIVWNRRRMFSLDWRRYHRLMALQTARYLMNALMACARGEVRIAYGLAKVVIKHGMVFTGVVYLPIHAFGRCYGKACGTAEPRRRKPESWMGPPRAKAHTRDELGRIA